MNASRASPMKYGSPAGLVRDCPKLAFAIGRGATAAESLRAARPVRRQPHDARLNAAPAARR